MDKTLSHIVYELNLFSSASISQMNLTEVQLPSTQTLQMTQTWWLRTFTDMAMDGSHMLYRYTHFRAAQLGDTASPWIAHWAASEGEVVSCASFCAELSIADSYITPIHPNNMQNLMHFPRVKGTTSIERASIRCAHVWNMRKMSIFHQAIIWF